MPSTWSTHSLYEALLATDIVAGGQVSVELIQGAESSLHIVMHEYGDLSVFAGVFGEQIVVESLLWPQSDIRDIDAFNNEVLRTHKLFPLSSISLETLPDGQSCYCMFGALSASSGLKEVVHEVLLLADNVISATEAYAGFIKASA